MTNITNILIKELRERTGIGVMECKKALIIAQGNIELAIDNLRKSGQAKAAKKAGRITTEGIILTKITKDNRYGVIIELNCETDFVNKDNNFKIFSNKIINHALNERITNVEELRAKFTEEHAALVSKIGENINIRRLSVLEGDMLGYYLHGTRIGVIVSVVGKDVSKNEKLIKHIAMHIAANKPEYISPDNIPFNVFDREYQIQLDIAMKLGKPREIAEKMVEGRMRKFTNEISLIGQDFVIDPNKTVNQILNEHKMLIKNFIRFEVGEGIEKIKVNFAAEVAAIGGSFNENIR